MTLHSRNKLSDRVLAKAAGTLLFLSVCSLGFSVFTYQGDRSQGQSNQEKLGLVLQKAGEYCARLNRIALYFVCTEDIVERIFTPYRRLPSSISYSKTENRYLYDYQLIRRDKIEESRILLRENGIPSSMKDAPLKTQRFLYKYIIFGPIGIFGFEKQKLYDYSFEKETKLWGKPTLIVKAVPKNPKEVNCLYGKAWVDKNDGSILRIEWEGISLGNYEAALATAKRIGAKPRLMHYSEYRIEKNGIRFPSLYKINEEYYRTYRIEKSQLLVKYSDYKFFTVDTEVKIKIR
jgi:hypothetical protein